MNLKIDYQVDEAIHQLTLSGEIDAYTASELTEKLVPLMKKKGNKIIVDLSDIEYMDSTGLGVFVGALKTSKKNGSELILKNLTDRVQRLFEITGLNEVIAIENDDRAKGGAK